MKLITKCLIWFQRRTLSAKLSSGSALTLTESLMAVSDPELRHLIAEREHPITIELPRNVVIRGADNIVFERNVRIHSEESMAITTHKILTINDPDMKQDSFVSAETLAQSFEKRFAAIELELKQSRELQQKLSSPQAMIGVSPKCLHNHEKRKKHYASSGKTGRQVQGTPKPRSNDSGNRKPGYHDQRKTPTQKG